MIILLIILLVLFGGGSGWAYNSGYYGGSGIGLILTILIIFLLLRGRL